MQNLPGSGGGSRRPTGRLLARASVGFLARILKNRQAGTPRGPWLWNVGPRFPHLPVLRILRSANPIRPSARASPEGRRRCSSPETGLVFAKAKATERRKTSKKFLLILFILGLLSSVLPPPLYAGHDENFAYINRGFFRILTAAFQIPRYLLMKTLSEPLGLGTVDGALTGVYYAVAELTGGALDIGRGAAPYAKYMVFFI